MGTEGSAVMNFDDSFKAIARVSRRKPGGMFGLVLEVPSEIAKYIGAHYWVVYGNACYYCNSLDEVKVICDKHEWFIRLFEAG